jgi:hypothetical protein
MLSLFAEMISGEVQQRVQPFSSSIVHSDNTNRWRSLQTSQRSVMDAVRGRFLSSSPVTLKFERNVRCVVGHLKINAPIDDPRRLSRGLMALRVKTVCAADHNKDARGLSFGLTPTNQPANEAVHPGAFQLARVFLSASCDFSKAFSRECSIIERSGSFDPLILPSAGGRPRPRHIRIFNAFPVGFLYSRLMDGAEAPYELQHGATDASRTADF